MTTIRVGHLYPDYLNIYADRGNIAVLTQRAAWRGHELVVTALGMGDAIVPGEHDLYYAGGGQDREQLLVGRTSRRRPRRCRRRSAVARPRLPSAAATSFSAAAIGAFTARTCRASGSSRSRPSPASAA